MDKRPVLIWFRRDLRLADHPALTAASASGRPVIPVFLCDETVETLGAAPKWRLGLGVAALAEALTLQGSRLILRRGRAQATLDALIAETGAGAVFWTRYYEPAHIARDRAIKAALTATGIEARSYPGALLAEPGQVVTGAGRPYAVFTPFWRALRARDVGQTLPTPAQLSPPPAWPLSETMADWGFDRAMGPGARVVRPHLQVGAAAAGARLAAFLGDRLARYAADRDTPAADAGSGLSENLAWGEISPRQVWCAAERVRDRLGAPVDKFLSELGWREFAWHLMFAHPAMATACWRPEWERFAWRPNNDDAEAWRRGMTGVPMVDAGLREMFVTGRMHNRVRMIAASYLTKHLLTDWRVGLGWFQECLIDWDPAANALGWQWVAGCGPDAAPFFRIFNPDLQAARHDPDGRYRARFLAEGPARPDTDALAFFNAAPKAWALSFDQPYPAPRIGTADGRHRALAALARLRTDP